MTRCEQELINGEVEIEAFLTHLAVDKEVSPSPQNQVMNEMGDIGSLSN